MEIARDLLPPRRLRVNPRVVKRNMSGFALKRRIHRYCPQPPKRIPDAVKVIGEALIAITKRNEEFYVSAGWKPAPLYERLFK